MNFYYADKENQVRGPLTACEIADLHSGSLIFDSTMICRQGTEEWLTYSEQATRSPLKYAKTKLHFWALILSLIGLFTFMAVIPAIILGHISLSRFRLLNRSRSRWVTRTALVISYVRGSIYGIMLIFYFVTPQKTTPANTYTEAMVEEALLDISKYVDEQQKIAIVEAIRQGRIAVGMNSREVMQAKGTRYEVENGNQISAEARAYGIVEVWVFSDGSDASFNSEGKTMFAQ